MTDRNTQESIKKDIDFIEEIAEEFTMGYEGDALGKLDEWKDELIGRLEE